MADKVVASDDGLGTTFAETIWAMYRHNRDTDAGKLFWCKDTENTLNFSQILLYTVLVAGARAEDSRAPATATREGILLGWLCEEDPAKVLRVTPEGSANERAYQEYGYGAQGCVWRRTVCC